MGLDEDMTEDKIEAWLKHLEEFKSSIGVDATVKLLALVRVYREANQYYANHKTYRVNIDGSSTIWDDADDYPRDAKFGVRARAAEAKAEEIIK